MKGISGGILNFWKSFKICFSGLVSMVAALGFSSAVFAGFKVNYVTVYVPPGTQIKATSLPAGCSESVYLSIHVSVFGSAPQTTFEMTISDAQGTLIGPVKSKTFNTGFSGQFFWGTDFVADETVKRPFTLNFYDTGQGGYQSSAPTFQKTFDPVNIPGMGYYGFTNCKTLDYLNQNDPVFYFGPANSDVFANEDQTVNIQLPVQDYFDPDGDTLTFVASGLPPGLFFDQGDAAIMGTIAVGASVASPYAVTVTANDGSGSGVTASFTYNIAEAVVTNPAGPGNPLPGPGGTRTKTGDLLSGPGNTIGGSTPVAGSGGSWSPWLNRDSQGGSRDYETLQNFIDAGQIDPNPVEIQCRTRAGQAWDETGQTYTCDVTVGGICRHDQQEGGQRCLDYEVRFRH